MPAFLGSWRKTILGNGAQVSARQAALLFMLSGVMGVVGLVLGAGDRRVLLAVTAADMTVALAALLLPWNRWAQLAPALLISPALVVLALSTWAFGGIAAGTGPFFVVLFCWAGLRFPRWVLNALLVPAAVAYVVPLVISHQPPAVIGSVVILLPVAWAVATLIAEQQQAQRSAYCRLAELEQRRADLAATLAHDVRSPLNSIQLVLETVRDDRMPAEERGRFLDAAARQVQRVVALSEDLLDNARLDERARLVLQRRRLALRNECAAAIAFVDSARVSLIIGDDVTVDADAHRLQQMLINLVIAALREGDGQVTVSAYDDGARTHMRVCHQGAAVPGERRAQLFERAGWRPENGQSARLGLWIVRQFAQAHGGDVRYEPGGAGGCFVVSLPTRADERHVAERSA